MENIIRCVEREVLDKEYARFTIMNRGQFSAIGHLLKVTADLWRDEGLSHNVESAFDNTRMHLMLGGLGNCIRWITNAHKQRIRLHASSWQELDQEALAFLVWGMKYYQLSTDHIAWSRKILQADIDVTNKVIKFSAIPTLDCAFLLSQQCDERRALTELYKHLPIESIHSDFLWWRRHIKVVDGGFSFAEDLARNLKSYSKVVDWLESSVLSGVDGKEDLGGYTLDEFRRFFAALFLNCTFWTMVEDDFDDLCGLQHDFGSSMLTLPRSSMIKYLQNMSGLGIEAVKSVVGTLTYDVSNIHASLMNQPVVQSSNERIFILPRLIAHINPSRMLVGAMNKGVGRGSYARFIEPVSRTSLSEIASMFQRLNLEVWQEKRIHNNRGTLITPDLMVFDRAEGQLLVADYKHFLPPIGVSDVVYKINELEKGLEQVRRYLSFMKDPAIRTNESLLQGINKVMGLLIFGCPMVIPTRVNPDVALANRFSLSEQLNQQTFTSLSNLVAWAKMRPEMSPQSSMMREQELEVKVSDWTYKRSVFSTE